MRHSSLLINGVVEANFLSCPLFPQRKDFKILSLFRRQGYQFEKVYVCALCEEHTKNTV